MLDPPTPRAETSPSTAGPREAGAADETPLFFESAGHPLYAVHHAPRAPRPGAPVLVLCHSPGVEQLTSYRNDVTLARAAAALGLPAFRFHARGHGDSGGDFATVTFETLVEDARAAAEEARRRSGAARVLWLGVRLGALVAAGALGRGGEAAGLVLWEPVHRSAPYVRGVLRGMLISQVAHGMKPSGTVDGLMERLESEGRVDVHGYFLHRRLVESLQELELARLLEGWRGPTLIAQVQGRPRLSPENAALAAALESRGAAVRTLEVREEMGWLFVANPAWECPPLVRGTEEWLRAVA